MYQYGVVGVNQVLNNLQPALVTGRSCRVEIRFH